MKLKLLFILIPILLLSSCKAKIPAYVFNNSCDLPCWNGLIPGSTTLEDSLKIMKNWEFTKSVSDAPFTRPDAYQHIVVWIKNANNHSEIAYLDSKVYYIDISFDLVNGEEFRKIYGDPKIVGYGRFVSVDYFYRDDYIIYPEKGLALYVRGPQKSIINDMYAVQGMIIADPSNIYDALKNINEGVDLEYSDWSSESN